MNNDIETPLIPGLVRDLLTNNQTQPDNLIADLWKELGIGHLIKRAGLKKRTGLPIE